MEPILVKDKWFDPYLTEAQLQNRISQLAHQINTDYENKTPILLPVLNGAFLFAADLIRQLIVNPELQFVRASSYGQSMHSSGTVEMLLGLQIDIKDRHVLVVEDIVDTGLTYDHLYQYLSGFEPASIEMVSLLFKTDNFKGKHRPHYIGYEIPPEFVVGYGLDYAQAGRELSGIYRHRGA